MKMFFRKGAVLLTAAHLAGSLLLFGQSQTATRVDGPRIKFLETTFDFGRVQPTDKLTHDFIVTNLGNAVLEITDVTSSCGCTTVGAWDRKVPPGGTGKIPVNLNPLALRGATAKHVAVFCNDPAHSGDSLQVQATVWREVDVEPQTTHFVQVEGEATNETKTVRIVNNLEDPITLEPPQSTNPNFVPELRTVKPGKEFELKITCRWQATNMPQGLITMQTSSPKVNILNVSAYALLQPALVVTPAEIQVPDGVAGAKSGAIVLARNNSSTLMKITDPVVNADGVTVQAVDANPGKFFNIRITFPPEFQVPAGRPLELTFKTTHPKYPLVRVPIVQAAAPASAAHQK
jgi:hypothetical protein